jgi:DnaJ-class molecular chaperone
MNNQRIIRLNCFRCDGKGKFRNEFGLMEKCESCQGEDMIFEKVVDENSDE